MNQYPISRLDSPFHLAPREIVGNPNKRKLLALPIIAYFNEGNNRDSIGLINHARQRVGLVVRDSIWFPCREIKNPQHYKNKQILIRHYLIYNLILILTLTIRHLVSRVEATSGRHHYREG